MDCKYLYSFDMSWRLLETQNSSDQTLKQQVRAPGCSPASDAVPFRAGSSNLSNSNALGLLNARPTGSGGSGGGQLVERYEYTPYGQRTVLTSVDSTGGGVLLADLNNDGIVDQLDLNLLLTYWQSSTSAGDDAHLCDLDASGTVDRV